MQRNAPKLPPELWAKVLSKLPQQDLFTARLVSKDFVPISTLPSLDLSWAPLTRDTTTSLMIFVSRHLQQQPSPELRVTMRNRDPWDSCNMPIMLASSCANLRHLTINACLGLHDARSYLRVLPSGLRTLNVNVPAELMEDTAWHRLTNLTSLQLNLDFTSRSRIGSTLASLSSLRALGLKVFTPQTKYREDGSVLGPRLEIASFAHPALKSLDINVDLFADGFNVKQSLPCLRSICVSQMAPLPRWLQDTCIDNLTIKGSSLQLRSVDMRRLLCKRLTAFCTVWNHSWELSKLLLLPATTKFELLRPDRAPIELKGTYEELKQLMQKMQANFDVPVQLRMRKDAKTEKLVELCGNGHPLACLCSECR